MPASETTAPRGRTKQADLRVSVWCGAPGHPRKVLAAESRMGLYHAERFYRCPTCGRPDAWIALGGAHHAIEQDED